MKLVTAGSIISAVFYVCGGGLQQVSIYIDGLSYAHKQIILIGSQVLFTIGLITSHKMPLSKKKNGDVPNENPKIDIEMPNNPVQELQQYPPYYKFVPHQQQPQQHQQPLIFNDQSLPSYNIPESHNDEDMQRYLKYMSQKYNVNQHLTNPNISPVPVFKE